MPESELAKEMQRVIKRADKLIGDMRKNTWGVLEALRELRQGLSGKEGKDEETETK